MRNSEQLTKSLKRFRYTLFLGVAAMAITSWGMPNISEAPTTPTQQNVKLMSQQTAKELNTPIVAKTNRLANVNKHTLYFSDRPNRIACNLTIASYLDYLTARAVKDNFANDPPNATV